MSYFKTQTHDLGTLVAATGAQTAASLSRQRAYDKVRVFADFVSATASDTLDIEISPDEGVTWFVAATLATAGTDDNVIASIDGPVTDIRAVVNTLTSGTVTITAQAIRNP